MENDNWVDSKLTILAPPEDWTPDVAAALASVRRRQRLKSARVWSAIAASVILLMAALPEPRAAAQRVWNLMRLSRVEVLSLDFSSLPAALEQLKLRVTVPPTQQPAASHTDASARAGFDVRLPPPRVFADSPRLAVVAPMAAETTIDVEKLRAGLAQTGVTDMRVPDTWHGGRLVVNVGPLVIADYRDVQLIQTRPVAIATPPDLDFALLAEMVLRSLRVPRESARRFAERMQAAPGLLLGLDAEDRAEIRELRLRHGPGTLIRDIDKDGGPDRTSLVWSTPDRLYAISGNVPESLLITAANSIE
jgi:hypothetical protein